MVKQNEVKYYLVNDHFLYCCSNCIAFNYLPNGTWIECDYIRCVADYLYGFDESEPLESPYRFGNYSISSQIQEISENEVINRFGRQAVLSSLLLFK